MTNSPPVDHNEQASAWRAWLVVITLMVAMILSLIDRFAISIMVEPIKAALNISDTQIGLLTGIGFGLFYACMGLPMGMLADSWSRKGTIIFGMGVWSLATAASGLANTFSHLLVARIGVGAGEAGLAPPSYSIIHDLFPKEKLSRALSIFQLGAVIGSGLAFYLVGLVYQYFENMGSLSIAGLTLAPWQATFIAASLPGAPLMLLLGAIRMPRNPAKATGTINAQPHTGLVAALRAQPNFYALLFAAMAGTLMVNYLLLSWVPAIAQREFQMSMAQIGSLYGQIVIGTCSIALIGGAWVVDALFKRGVTTAHVLMPMISAMALFPLTLLLFVTRDAMSFFIVVSCMHFLISLPVAVVPALIQLRSPASARARVSSLYVLAINVTGIGLAPIIAGILSDVIDVGASSLRLAVAIASTMAGFISVITSVALYRREARRARRTPSIRGVGVA